MDLDRKNLVGIILTVFICFIQSSDCLTCYFCALTEGLNSADANANCLVNSTEVICQNGHNRCYSSISGTDSNKIDKGCTSSGQCIGNTICCTENFCNAGYATGIKTGHGKSCQLQSDCIQEPDDMTCSQTYDDIALLCRCTETRFSHGAICKPKSNVEERCYNDDQCLLYNSYCEDRRCKCGDQFYPNRTGLACLLKRSLTDQCTMDIECRARNSLCNGEFCACQFGSYAGPGEDHCSGAVPVVYQNVQSLSITITSFIISLQFFF